MTFPSEFNGWAKVLNSREYMAVVAAALGIVGFISLAFYLLYIGL